MREESSGARDARDPNHIWLRQSVTFSVNGQTRTLELALPLRPGATPDEVEALLDEADAGMRRLSSRLDAHLAEVTGAAPSASPSAPERHERPERAERAERHEAPPAPRPAAPTRPVEAAPASVEKVEKPAEKPAPRPTTAPATAPAASPATAAPAASGPDLTRPEFLAAVGVLGLDARTVMERLNVRSLNGLNLREALDLLRRQVVRDGGVSTGPSPASATSQSPAAHAERPAPIGAPRFDEEDDSPTFELSYPDSDDLPGEEEFESAEDFAPLEATPATTPSAQASSAPISDVPDLEELLNGGARKAAEDATTTRAREVIATMRAAHPGGQATPHQRTAYQHVVIDQIGEAKAASVARAMWTLTPEQLGPEHYDAFTRWGKEDDFAEEVEAALAILRAEYAAERAAKQSGKSSAPASAQPTAKPATKPADAPPARRAAQEPAERPAPPRGRTTSARNGSQGGA